MKQLARLLNPRKTDESHRVTTVELFFDLVFVFAFTQVTAWIAHEHSLLGVAQGLLILTIMWWAWIGFTWLGNIVHADSGAPLAGFILAMAAGFVVALTARHVWDEPAGALAPLLFTGAYAAMRLIHAAVYAWVSRDSSVQLKQIAISTATLIPVTLVLLAGARADPDERLWWWTGALLLDLGQGWVISLFFKGWGMRSGGHLAERFGLIVILALGESVVAVGVAAEAVDLSSALVWTAILGVFAAAAFWWIYFKDIAPPAEHAITIASPDRQFELGRDAFSYLHLPLVGGIIIAAAGVEEAVFALADAELAGVAASLLSGGAALVCASGASILAVVRGPWWWLAGASAFFAGGAFWMPAISPIAALTVTTVVLAAIGFAIPNKHKETS